LLNLTADGKRVVALRINCSDAVCQNCEYFTAPSMEEVPFEDCFVLQPGQPGVHVLASAAIYNVSGGACLGSLDSNPPLTHGVVSALYRGSTDNCTAPTTEDEQGVLLQHWGVLGSTPQCTLEETNVGEYASLRRYANIDNRTMIAGEIGCNATCSNESCTGSVDGLLRSCIPVDGDSPGYIRFIDTFQLAPCYNAKPKPTPEPGNSGRGGIPYAAVVVGGTLGGFAILWVACMMIFSKMWEKPVRPGAATVQGSDEASRLVPARGGRSAFSPSAYSSIDG
jgi:hypothetical protein